MPVAITGSTSIDYDINGEGPPVERGVGRHLLNPLAGRF
jgi:hypothetical protein